jgi:hypothetical protein
VELALPCSGQDQDSHEISVVIWISTNNIHYIFGMNLTNIVITAAGILSDSFGVKRPWSSPCPAVGKTKILREFSGSPSFTNDEGRAMAELICFVAPGKCGVLVYLFTVLPFLAAGW